MRKFLIPLILCLLALPGALAAQAGGTPTGTPSREVLEAIAAKLRIDPDSRQMRRLMEDQYRRGRGEEPKLRSEEELEKVPVLIHLRGRKGVPIPSPEENVPVIELTAEQKEQIITSFNRGQNQMVEAMKRVPEIPKCRESRTTKVATGYKGDRKDKTALFDMLFIRKSEIPLDPDEVFGRTTFVNPFYTERANAPSLSAVGMGIPCLPYRMRVTRGFSFRDEGLNALRNYDEDPEGEGDLHESLMNRQAEFN